MSLSSVRSNWRRAFLACSITDKEFLVWSLIYTLSSMGIGLAATRLFSFPSWVTPAISFNNTTALPLLLIQSLDATGILEKLIVDESDTSSAALKRAKSYFLVCAIVGNCLTFALGPRLLDSEHSPDSKESKPEDDDEEENGDVEHGQQNGHSNGEAEEGQNDEHTSLLPNAVEYQTRSAERTSKKTGKKYWNKLSPRTQKVLDIILAFFNAPLIGAIIGAILGLVPPLHKVFFNTSEEGGVFNAWLTTSLSNIGDLFASLQVVVVGVSLSSSLRKLKRGEDSGSVPWIPSLFVLVVRFILWPIVSIAVIWAVATKTRWLSDDPMLWFVMMLMPTGPSAMKLVAMADVNGADEGEKMSISKFLTVSAFPLYTQSFLPRSKQDPRLTSPRFHTWSPL